MLQQERAYPRLHWSVRTALRPLITAHGQITAFDLTCGGNGGNEIVNSPSSSTSSSISSTCSNTSGGNSNGSNTSNQQQKRHRRTKNNSVATTSSSQQTTDENDETDEEPVLWGGPVARWDPDRRAVSSSRPRRRCPTSTFALVRRRRLRFAAAVAAAKANDQRCVEHGNWAIKGKEAFKRSDFAKEIWRLFVRWNIIRVCNTCSSRENRWKVKNHYSANNRLFTREKWLLSSFKKNDMISNMKKLLSAIEWTFFQRNRGKYKNATGRMLLT